MTDYQTTLQKLHTNLNTLREREAKYAGNTPLELLNKISDHEQAIVLTEQAISNEITEAEWQEATRPLLLALDHGQVINIEAATYVAGDQHIHQAAEEPPVWRRISRTSIVLGIVFGLVATIATVLAVPGVSDFVYGIFSPAPFPPATDGQILVVVATFHVPEGVANTEPHTKIRRAIESAGQAAGLDTLRVEEEPTILKADEREAAKTLGESYDANIIIWGEDTGVEVIVNYLNLKEPDFAAADVIITEDERTQIETNAEVGAYKHFITKDLPGQLTFLSLLAVGHLYSNQREYDQAINVTEKGIASLVPGSQPEGLAVAYFGLGWMYRRIHPPNDEKSLAYYNLGIEFDPTYALAYNNRGNIHRDKGDLEAAMADFDRAIELDPNYTLAFNNRGLVHKRQGNLQAAIDDYTKAISIDPEYIAAYGNRGMALTEQGDLGKALKDFEKIIALDPTIARAYVDLGHIQEMQGNLDAALANLDQALEIDPNLDFAYNNRGILYRNRGELEAALDDYNRAIELNPEYSYAYNNRGLVYKEQGDLEQAIADYTKAIELDPEYANAYHNRGLVYKEQGDVEQAIADYTKAIEFNPEYSRAYFNRGSALEKQGDLEQAVADFETGLTYESDPEIRERAEEELKRLHTELGAQLTPTPEEDSP